MPGRVMNALRQRLQNGTMNGTLPPGTPVSNMQGPMWAGGGIGNGQWQTGSSIGGAGSGAPGAGSGARGAGSGAHGIPQPQTQTQSQQGQGQRPGGMVRPGGEQQNRFGPGGGAYWLERGANQNQQPPPGTGINQPNSPYEQKPKFDENAFFDNQLTQRMRANQSGGRAGLNMGLSTLETRGLGQSSGVTDVFSSVNQQIGAQNVQAQNDIYGQQFALNNQRDQTEQQFQNQLKLGEQDFEHRSALLRLQKQLGKGGGGVFAKLAKIAGGALAGFVAGGPLGAIAGGVGGAVTSGGDPNYAGPGPYEQEYYG